MVFIVYQDLHPAMKMLGLNPSEQEVVDIPNNIAKYDSDHFFLCRSKSNESSLYRKGLIYFPEFCQLILKWFRDNKEAKENFNQNMFKVSHGILLHHKMCKCLLNLKILCGTDPFPKDFRAKKYKMDKHSITKVS